MTARVVEAIRLPGRVYPPAPEAIAVHAIYSYRP